MNYDTTVSSTTSAFTMFIILEWIRSKNSDYHSLGKILLLCDYYVRDIKLSEALGKLVSIIMDGLSNGTLHMDESVRGEVLDWYVSQPNFIRLICGKQLAALGLVVLTVYSDGGMSTVA